MSKGAIGAVAVVVVVAYAAAEGMLLNAYWLGALMLVLATVAGRWLDCCATEAGEHPIPSWRQFAASFPWPRS